ncbi:hypothetical protein LTS18_008798, partial [Coniosporium uncinatum]
WNDNEHEDQQIGFDDIYFPSTSSHGEQQADWGTTPSRNDTLFAGQNSDNQFITQNYSNPSLPDNFQIQQSNFNHTAYQQNNVAQLPRMVHSTPPNLQAYHNYGNANMSALGYQTNGTPAYTYSQPIVIPAVAVNDRPYDYSHVSYARHSAFSPVLSSQDSCDAEAFSPISEQQEPVSVSLSRESSTGPRNKKSWCCPESGCSRVFKRKADCQRHVDCVHRADRLRLHPCTVRRCSRGGDNGFKRKDHLTEHMRNFHHQQIPKRNTGNGNLLQVIATHDYSPTSTNQMSLRCGDSIFVHQFTSEYWGEGENQRSGKSGMFPRNHVREEPTGS